jgi:outer membrane receptor protein involved in Fe transport
VTTFSSKRQLAIRLAHLGTSVAAIAVAGSVAVPTAALAQSNTSTLRGHAAPGVEVVASEIATGVVRRATSGSDGNYVITGLQTGTYHVTAGGQAVDVVVPVASEQVQNFDTPTATRAGSIVVTGRRPSVDVHTSQVNQYVSLHDIASLPQTTRNFLEFADTVPGMQFNVAGTTHNTSLRGGAQLDSAVNLYIDGVSQKDYVGSGGGTGGSGSGFTGSGGNGGNGDPGNPFPQLAVAEYKVVSSNYTAEYGDASSAIIIAQTKSGTNRFQGEAFGTYTNEHLRASLPGETVKKHQPSKEYGVAIGGPIVKDVAHFFFTWEHKSLADYTTVFPSGSVPASAIALLPTNISSQLNVSVTNPFTENLYFGKIDLEPTQNDRVEVTGNLRLETNFTGSGGQNAESTEVPYKNNVKRYDGRWQHNGTDWFNAVRVSYQDALSAAQTTTASPQFDYFYFPNPPAPPLGNQNRASIINVGGPGAGVGVVNRQKGWTIADDVTFTNLHLAGDHTLKFGASYGSIKLTTQNASADVGNATYFFAVTPTGVAPTPFEIQYPNLTAGFNTARVTTTDKQYTAYAQDNWDVNRHLTVNLGLRWDREEVPAYLNYVTPANVVAAINGPYCIATSPQPCTTTQTYASVLNTNAPGAPAINIADYISTGSNRKAPNHFSPRLGFSYDVHGDNRLVLFGGYARAYNRNLFSTLALETTKIALNGNPQIYFPSQQTPGDLGQCLTSADVNTGHCYAWDPKYLTPGGLAGFQTNPNSHEVDLMNNNIKTPYSDQFSLGIRSRLGDWNTQATVSYVASYNGIYGHWGARYQNGQFYQNGAQWGGQGVPGVGTLILWDNGFKDRDLQIALGAQKPYTKQSGWSATVAYTFSAAEQNNAYAYGAAGNMYLFDYPIAADYPTLRSSAVPRHRLVLTGTLDLPWDMQLGAKLALATSVPTTVIYGCGSAVPGCNPYNSIGGGIGGVVSLTPHDFLGYKDLDLQLTKNFTFFNLFTAYARVDAINVFNWKNYDPGAIQNVSVNGVPVSAHYNPNGGIVGAPFTVRLSAGVRFGDRPRPTAPVAEVPPPPPPPPPPVVEAPPPPPPPPAPAPAPERG